MTRWPNGHGQIHRGSEAGRHIRIGLRWAGFYIDLLIRYGRGMPQDKWFVCRETDLKVLLGEGSLLKALLAAGTEILS